MYPTSTLWLEIGVAILLGLAFLWTKAEYGLFLYAFSLGFPDFAYPLGTTVNIRLDDVLIVLFLARAILWAPAPLSRGQRNIFTWQAIFLAACLLSIAVETAQGTPPGGYDAARMAGCAVIVVVLPLLVQSERRLRFFVAGLMCGGVALVFAAVCLCAILYLHSRDPQLMEDATTVNLTTGEGFSHRFERWDMAFRAIQTEPYLGQGFGQEIPYLTLLGSEGRAHNAYLAVWLELGLGGLLLFLAAVFQYVRAGFFLYGNPRFQSQGGLILALTFALGLDSLALSTLYWEKLPTIALALAVAVVGMCERNDLEFTVGENRIPAYEPFAQHS